MCQANHRMKVKPQKSECKMGLISLGNAEN